MRILIKTKNLELTSELQSFIEEKIGSLKKFLDILKRDDEPRLHLETAKIKILAEVAVEVERETTHHKKGQIFLAKADIVLPGKKLMGEAKSEDLGKAVILLREQLEQEIKKYKVKKIDNVRRKQMKTKEELNY